MFEALGIRGGRLLVAGLLATALSVVLATRVFVSFEAHRVKLVREPVATEQGVVRIDTSVDLRAAELEAPVAVIAVVRHRGTQPERVSIRADGRLVCEVEMKPAAVRRVDCVAHEGWTRNGDHLIEIQGASSDWTLEYFELASHHGSSSGALPLIVLPDVATRYGRAGPVALVSVWLLLTIVLATPAAPRWPRALVTLHRALSALLLLALLVVVAAPWLSSFLVLMSVGAFVKVGIVLSAPQLAQIGSAIWARARRRLQFHPQWRPLVIAVGVSAVVFVAFGLVLRATAAEFDGRYSGLLRVSERTFDGVPYLSERADIRSSLVLLPDNGYDGQFHYFAMFDPLMLRYRHEPQRYRAVADAPPYRFGRIGFPWLARLVAGNRWERYPAVLIGLVWIGVALSALALTRLAQQSGASPAWGLLVLGVPGFWVSAKVVLPEPLAAAMLLLGYWCVQSRHVALASVLFAASLLIRETGVVFVLAIALLTRSADLRRRSRAALLCSIAPLVVWRAYVGWVLWPDWGWQGVFYSPHSLAWPLEGVRELWSTLWRGEYFPGSPEVARAALWYPVLLIGAAATSLALVSRNTRPVGAALALYAVMAISLSYQAIWVHVGNAQRGSYEIFVMLALSSLRFRHYPRPLQGAVAAVWVGAGLYLFYGSFDARAMRGALLPWG